MKLNESIIKNLTETSIPYGLNLSIDDFIADGKYTYGEKIKYIADQLEESGHVDVYADENYNKYLLDVASILNRASDEIDRLSKN